MPLVFACGVAHAPGIVGWPGAAPAEQRTRFHSAYQRLGEALRVAQPDTIIVVAAEHWANFFLNNYPAFCIGRAGCYVGPLEQTINIPRRAVTGNVGLATALLATCYEKSFEPSFSDELTLDHGIMVPLHLLAPGSHVSIVPIIVNALAPPLPTPQRCFDFGTAMRAVIDRADERIAVIASGGLSHRPGTPRAGEIDTVFDRNFLDTFCAADHATLCRYTYESIAPAGFGAQEIRNWITVAAIVGPRKARVLAYEPIVAWSTGCALVQIECCA